MDAQLRRQEHEHKTRLGRGRRLRGWRRWGEGTARRGAASNPRIMMSVICIFFELACYPISFLRAYRLYQLSFSARSLGFIDRSLSLQRKSSHKNETGSKGTQRNEYLLSGWSSDAALMVQSQLSEFGEHNPAAVRTLHKVCKF